MRRRDTADLALVLFLALVVRLWGFHWGLPGPAGEMTPIERAWQFWNWGRPGGPSFNPHDFGWPSLIFYLAFAQQALFYAWGRMTGSFASTADFRILYELDPSPLILLGRAFSTLADLGVIALTWVLARTLFGRVPAVLAASVIALDLHHVAWSQNTGPEVWVALFVLLASLSLLRIAARGHLRDYLLFGLWCGLGTATKYTPALLFIALPFAHVAAPERRLRRAAGALGAALAAFFIASPFVILDARESLFFIFSQSRRLAAVPHFGQESLGPGWLFYLTNSLPESIGWVWLIVGIAGMVIALRRLRHREGIREGIVFIFPALYFLVFGAGSSKYDHYMLPITPFLAVAGAGLLWRLTSRTPRAIPWAIAAVALAFPAAGIVKRHELLARPDTRAVARDWIEKNIPRGALIVTEFGGPNLLTMERVQFIGTDPTMRDIAPRLLPLLAARPAYAVVTLPLYAQEPMESAPFYDLALYDGFQYCVLSSEVSGRYRADPRRFHAQLDFYRRLSVAAKPLDVFRPDRGPGPTIEIYSLAGTTGNLAALEGIRADALIRRAFDGVRRYSRLRAERAGDFAVRLGRAFESGGDLVRAATAWSLAIEFLPGDVEIHQALGDVLGRMGRDDLARREYEQVLALAPDHVGALNNLGGLELRSGHPDRARRLFERALVIRPDFADAHANLGWILWLNDHDGPAARRHFEEALRLAPAHPGAARLRMAIDEIARQEQAPERFDRSGVRP